MVLTNVLSFDVKVYDNRVPLYLASDNRSALVPSDVGYWTSSGTVVGYGAYVDLGYGYNWNLNPPTQLSTMVTPFIGKPATMPGNSFQQLSQWNSGGNYTTQVFFPTYDTWSLHYESPGSWNSYTGIGNNGLDDPDVISGLYVNGVDDPGEFQFPAPYPTPLRGIQVKIRTYEPDSKQIREVTIVQDFVPQ